MLCLTFYFQKILFVWIKFPSAPATCPEPESDEYFPNKNNNATSLFKAFHLPETQYLHLNLHLELDYNLCNHLGKGQLISRSVSHLWVK